MRVSILGRGCWYVESSMEMGFSGHGPCGNCNNFVGFRCAV